MHGLFAFAAQRLENVKTRWLDVLVDETNDRDTLVRVQSVHLEANETLFREGDTDEDVYIVESGQMALTQQSNGTSQVYALRERGGIVGALSVLTGLPRNVGCFATKDTTLIRVSKEIVFNEFQNLDPLLRACIETSLNFYDHLHKTPDAPDTPKVFPPHIEADNALRNYQFEVDLIKAIKSNSFEMVYQPIVELTTGAIVGFESLMRWTHETRGAVPPNVFITAAEKLGVIAPLTDFAIAESCKTLKLMNATSNKPRPYFASVNISGDDIARNGFAEQLAFILDEHETAPEQIKLEVTETAIMPDTLVARANLKALKSLGCGLSIDDFGTGYSNLAHLKTLPLSALKIDRAFAGDAHRNHVSGCIVSMLVRLGAAMGVDIVAEGVETGDDVQALTSLGCNLAQGFFLHRPTTRESLISLIKAPASMTPQSGVA